MPSRRSSRLAAMAVIKGMDRGPFGRIGNQSFAAVKNRLTAETPYKAHPCENVR